MPTWMPEIPPPPMMRAELKYVRKLTLIKVRYRINLVKLWFAGKLLKLAFELSPVLQKSYNAYVVEAHYKEVWPFE